MKKIILSASALALLTLSGCATIFGDTSQTLNFKADKASKIILTDGSGSNRYDVPGAVPITKGIEHVSYRVDCEQALEQNISRKITNVFWLNIIGGGLVGSGIDYVTGAMWDYEANVTVPASSCEE